MAGLGILLTQGQMGQENKFPLQSFPCEQESFPGVGSAAFSPQHFPKSSDPSHPTKSQNQLIHHIPQNPSQHFPKSSCSHRIHSHKIQSALPKIWLFPSHPTKSAKQLLKTEKKESGFNAQTRDSTRDKALRVCVKLSLKNKIKI